MLYVAPRHHEGRPLEENWIARAGSENFARLVDYQDAYQPGALRFDMGERTNFHLMPMARMAMAQLVEWGIEEIQATLSARNVAIAERAAPLGFTSPAAGFRAGHFLGLERAEGFPDDLIAQLAAKTSLSACAAVPSALRRNLY